VPFIINDHPSLASETGVEGIHVGVEDMTVAEARRLAGGRSCWVGKSSHSLLQALDGAGQGADYLGFGPLFATATKPDYVPIGTDEIRAVYEQIRVPVFCIGGIKQENLAGVIASGAQRVVIVSGILLAVDPVAYTRACVDQLAQAGISG
jgi:thiamine-phosphate pyrophosphorylase